MKTARKIFSLILALVLAAATPMQVFAQEEAQDFPASDSPMIENTTDSSNYPKRAELTDVYGIIENDKAETVESLISDEALGSFASSIDLIDSFQPVSNQDATLVLGKVENFMTGGGLGAYLKSSDPQLGAEIGLTANRTEKVRILGEGTNASGWVFVVDKDAICWMIKDTDGAGISGALVTISYQNEQGQRVTKSTTTTAGNTPGIAVFDDLPESCFGLVDIQAEGYRSVSILDKEMIKGDHYTIVMEDTKANDLYIRGVDLAGKDMVNEETLLSLMNMDTGDLTLKVLVTKSGSAQFPDKITINADNRGAAVLELTQTGSVDFDSNTKVYSATKRWVEQSAGLFKEADIISLSFGAETFALPHVTVENAVCVPGSGETDVPLTQKSLNGKTEDRLGGGGWLNQGLQMFMIPVSFGMFPDGTYMLMASYDITRLDPNTQYKFSSLFQKSWNPKTFSSIKHPLEVFEKSFWENTEKVKKGQQILDSTKKIKAVSNPNYDFSLSFSLFLKSCYNKETDDSYGSGGILFSGGLTAGITEYFLITAGPVVIPLYIGFEGHLYIKTTLALNFLMDRAPTGHDQDAEWKYTTDDGFDVNARIEVLTGFSVFGGVGVKGTLGAAAVGYVDFDIATVLDKGQAHLLTKDPHSFIDVLYGLRIEYYLLFYSGTIKIDALQDAKRLDDSDWTDSQQIQEALLEGLEFSPISLEDCAEDFTYMPLAEGEAPRDEYYVLNNTGQLEESLGGQSKIIGIDSSIIPESQIQFAATKNYTTLFRMGSNGRRVDIYYQHQNRDTGGMWSGLYKVALPDDETRSVCEFVVVPNKTENSDKVYIAAVVVDDTLTDENARMRSTDVYAIVVDMDQDRTTSTVLASDPAMKGQYLYSAPKPAGREGYCSVSYAATRLTDSNGAPVDGLKGALGAVTDNTDYYISWGADGAPEQRSWKNLGKNRIYSTGVIAPNEPSFWVVDSLKSSDKYLYVKGYGANGFYEDTLRCNFRIDIEGLVALEDVKKGIVKFDSLITNWQYLNGCNYFIVGDSIYWMNKVGSGSSYEWSAEKVNGGAGVLSVDNRYALISNNNQSALYLIGVVGDYETNFETGASEKGYNIAKIYTITTDKDSSGKVSTNLHGPLDLKFAKGSEVRTFAVAYNPEQCTASGLTIAFTTQPANPAKYTEAIKMWSQNASSGMLATEVRIPDYLVVDGQGAIEMFVTLKNYGYSLENHVFYTIKDENGEKLMLTDAATHTQQWDPTSYSFSGADLYPGDSRVDRVLIKPNPNWDKNKEHEIIVDIVPQYKYDGDLDDMVGSVKLAADNVTLTAKNTLIGGKHYISTTIENNTMLGATTPTIKVVLDYAPSSDAAGTNAVANAKALRAASSTQADTKAGTDTVSMPSQLQFELPTDEMFFQFDEDDADLTGQIYHFDIDMDSVWEDGLDKGLRGAYVSLVDKDGNQQSNEVVYLLNPAEKAAEDEPDEPVTPDEPDDPKTGSVKLTLTDKDDPEKKLSGAVFEVYDKDGNKVGTLSETADGVYELEGLLYGDYTIKPVTVPEGYEAEESYPLTIAAETAELAIAFSAKSEEPDPAPQPEPKPDDKEGPGTGDKSRTELYLALMILSLLAAAAVIIFRRKEKA